MLHQLIDHFLDNCRMANFSERSIQALSARLKELSAYLKQKKYRSVKKVSYLDLVAFVADFSRNRFTCENRASGRSASSITF
jgi:site-specific recombinase XerD